MTDSDLPILKENEKECLGLGQWFSARVPEPLGDRAAPGVIVRSHHREGEMATSAT